MRRIPAVDRVLERPEIRRLMGLYGREPVRVQVTGELQEARDRGRAGDATGMESILDRLDAVVRDGLERRLGRPVRRVLNATGIFLHTNLGRAPLPRSVVGELPDLLDAACDLELDLSRGERGDRNLRLARLLTALTGAEAAVVVNNNASALLLALTVLARKREVVVSRGELVEIGGSFRIPEILSAAGARLREVGTTNRTRREDYAAAVGPDTALLLKIHPSNYRIRGFTEGVTVGELHPLAAELELPLLVDEGAGLLRPRREEVFRDHPSVVELLDEGADLTASSGDKLLGGPQAGLLQGDGSLIRRCRRHPLYRALRPDRTTVVALERVLRGHLRGDPLPLDRLWPDPGRHRARLERMAKRTGGEIVEADAFVGGGAAPDEPIPGEALAFSGSDELAKRLRLADPPVVGYLREDRLVLDLRTVAEEEDGTLAGAVIAARRGAE